MFDNLACKNKYLCPFLSFSMLPSLPKRIHTDIRVVPRLYYTGTRMNVSFWNENPNKLIQKWLVSNKPYSGIMWQPVWTRSWTKVIPISCKRPLKVFIPRASRFALLSKYYKFQEHWSNNPLLTASLPLKQRLVKKAHILIFSIQRKQKSL